MFRKLFLLCLITATPIVKSALPVNSSQVKPYHCVLAFLQRNIGFVTPHWWSKKKIRESIPEVLLREESEWSYLEEEGAKVFAYLLQLNAVNGYESVGDLWRYRFKKHYQGLAFKPRKIVRKGLEYLLKHELFVKSEYFSVVLYFLISDNNQDFPLLFLSFYDTKTNNGDKTFVDSKMADKILIRFLEYFKDKPNVETPLYLARLIIKVLDRIENRNKFDVGVAHGLILCNKALDFYSTFNQQVQAILQPYKERLLTRYLEMQN